MFFFFKQKTAYEVRISDWSSDVCSSDLIEGAEYLALQRGYIGIVVINRYRALENVVKIILCDAPDRILLALAGSCVGHEHARRQPDEVGAGLNVEPFSSEERRVGKECVSTCSSGWSRDTYKKKKQTE